MRAVVFLGDGRFAIDLRPKPRIAAPDEVLVRVEACGICGTDVHILDVPPGHPATPGTILGHEFVGRVEAVGPAVDPDLRGRRVAIDPSPRCGTCPSCRTGRPANCPDIVALGIFRDGALASHVVAPATACHPIRDDVPADVAALTEPLACVLNATGRAAVRPGESVVVFGGGPIGCLFAAVLAASGARPVVVVEPREVRARVALALGATVVVAPEALADRGEELLPGGADLVVDAVGSLLPEAIAIAAPGGRIVVFGMDDNARPPIHQADITRRSLTILGSYITEFTFPAAIRFLEASLVDLRPMISAVLPLERVGEGIEWLRARTASKIIITP
jgi:threonine dehydrogenase-like Zn-dependent dehydrogenase